MGRIGAMLSLFGLAIISVFRLSKSVRYEKRDRAADVQTLFDDKK